MACSVSVAQHVPDSKGKLSPYVRRLVMNHRDTRADDARTLTAFVKTASGNADVLLSNHCRVHAKMGDVFVVEIPFGVMPELCADREICRIETGPSCTALLDTTNYCVDYARVHAGTNIPRAFTGRGVVMGIMDVGFDLTSPNFYSRDMSDYRVRSFWDMLAEEKDDNFVVGREYVGRDAILALQHSRDNLLISHGTHTLGIAAGSGYNSSYVGVAPESDICLVNNAVVDDSVFISHDDEDKYTLATDALGFKYIFDYAESQGKPFVISFSEGSRQGFGEDNLLFHEALQSLVGPGKILVASAGNDGNMDYFLNKPADKYDCGSFIYSPTKEAYFILKSSADFNITLKSYGGNEPDRIDINSRYVRTCTDSIYNIVRDVEGGKYDISIMSYPSSFNPEETVYEMVIKADDLVGARLPLSVQLFGGGAEIQMYAYGCVFMENSIDPSLCDATSERTILTPASAPAVIAVGASSYREGFTNYKGEYKTWNNGKDGSIAPYSSVGPTFDGRIKPDVVAPGTNVISSYSSFYIEACPDAFDTQSDVARYDYNGRTYSWNANTGTSMASPVAGGIIALWLEANPNLSPDDVRDIFAQTCKHSDSSMEYPNNVWGHGEINAYLGLCHILGIDAIEGVENEAHSYCLIPEVNGFEVKFTSPLNEDVKIDVFSTDAELQYSATIAALSDSYRVSVKQGVYAVRITFGDRYESMLVRVK